MKNRSSRTILTITAFVFAIAFSATSAMADVYDAKFTVMKLTPNPISANQKGRAYFQLQNTGTVKWDANCRLKVTIFRAPSGGSTERDDLIPDPNLLRVTSGVDPDKRGEFYYDFTGPDWVGDYVLKVTMAKGNTEFGDAETVNLKVLPGQFDSRLEYRDITIQSAKKVGSTYELKRNDSYTVKVNIQNSGEALWQVGEVTLRTEAESADRRTVPNGTLAMGNLNLKEAVPGGETYIRTYTLRANVLPGKYELTFFLTKRGSVFGDTASILVNVVDK